LKYPSVFSCEWFGLWEKADELFSPSKEKPGLAQLLGFSENPRMRRLRQQIESLYHSGKGAQTGPYVTRYKGLAETRVNALTGRARNQGTRGYQGPRSMRNPDYNPNLRLNRNDRAAVNLGRQLAILTLHRRGTDGAKELTQQILCEAACKLEMGSLNESGAL